MSKYLAKESKKKKAVEGKEVLPEKAIIRERNAGEGGTGNRI